MKRLAILFAIMALLLVSAVASADPLPRGATEVEHWEWNGTAWVYHDVNSATALARAWRSGGAVGSCNKLEWEIGFTTHASMAQWSNWSIGGTRWDWRILKPGDYAADCIEFRLQSNNAVLIDYEGFDDLTRVEHQYPELKEGFFGAGVKQTIDTYYSFGESIGTAVENGWVRAIDLNNDDDTIPDSADFHEGFTTKLFTRIVVENCNSSGEYEDTATITLVLQNQQPWVDPSGAWADLMPKA